MRNFILGLLIGMAIVGTAWAANAIVLVSGDGTAVGTASNPLYITEA